MKSISLVRRSLGVFQLEKAGLNAESSPESCCQFLHRSFALLCFLLRATQDVPQLLQVVQRPHQLSFHRLHLALQHLRVMEGVSSVSSAGAHLLLQVLHCDEQPETHSHTPAKEVSQEKNDNIK